MGDRTQTESESDQNTRIWADPPPFLWWGGGGGGASVLLVEACLDVRVGGVGHRHREGKPQEEGAHRQSRVMENIRD